MASSLIRYIRTALALVILYYAGFAAMLLFLPPALFPLIGLSPSTVAWPLRLSAVIIGIMGLSLLFPVQAPLRHWSLTATVAIGQLVMPLVTTLLMAWGDLPPSVGIPMASVDVLFLVPCILALWWTVDLHAISANAQPGTLESVLDRIPDGSQQTLGDLSDSGPILVILLRHLGCTFCRASLDSLSGEYQSLKQHYHQIVIVTMSPLEDMLSLRTTYSLPGILLLSDPDRALYRAFSIPIGSISQTLGWNVWRRGLVSRLLFRYGIGPVASDPFQLPGSAVVEKRTIKWARPAGDASQPIVVSDQCSL